MSLILKMVDGSVLSFASFNHPAQSYEEVKRGMDNSQQFKISQEKLLQNCVQILAVNKARLFCTLH